MLRNAVIAVLLATSGALKVTSDPCPFGYGAGCGGGRPLDAATKAKVAGLLNGILGNLQGHSLSQEKVTVTKGGASSESDAVKSAMSELAEKLSEGDKAAKIVSDLIHRYEPYVKGKHYTWE